MQDVFSNLHTWQVPQKETSEYKLYSLSQITHNLKAILNKMTVDFLLDFTNIYK